MPMPRAAASGTAAQRGSLSARRRTASTGPSSPNRHAPTTAPPSAGRANTTVGSTSACQPYTAAMGFPDVRHSTHAIAAVTTAPAATPTSPAPARAARPPERAANTAVNVVKASGASDSQNVAASAGMPVAFRYSGGRAISSGTSWPSCQTRTDAGQSAPQSAPPPRPKTHSTVRGARAAATPTDAATRASTAARRATRRRFMRVRPYPADPGAPCGRAAGERVRPGIH